jgi:serine/threonine protein kinase/Tol biopolymer transport system component
MTPERHQQIGELYHDALERDADVRAAFLDRACAGDEALRREVESLIASHEQASNFIARPALAVAAGLVVRRDSLVGQTVAHYRVLSLVGEGGMGEVYLAEDTRLGRRVALKLLAAAFTNDKDRMWRFMQEARVASALNHPNILTVHEIGRADGVDFIATEFIEGETLRPAMAKRQLKLTQALDIAAQVAGALAAAHAAGVVHRDVKPENIMVRPDGYVKVLDFGLAKLAGPGLKLGNEASTVARVETNSGVVMGTVQYMSPEQARGLPVDARTDVWSLGVVLYEMVASRPPFVGETHSDTIVSILEREPPPLALHAPEVSAELERIVTKALSKDKDERYQTVKDMAIDLRRLRRRLDVDAEIERSAPPAQLPSGSGETTAISSGAQQSEPAQTEIQWAARASYADASRGTSSVEYVVTEIKTHKKSAALVIALLLVALAGIGYLFYGAFSGSRNNSAAPFQAMKLTKLTNTGKATNAAVSPDGKYVAHIMDDDGQQSLWMRHIETGSSVQIVPPAEHNYEGLTFSFDGNYVYYVVDEKGDTGVLYQVPVLGGSSRRLLANIYGSVTFSPDGKQMAFLRADQQGNILMLANTDGTGERNLASRKIPNQFRPGMPVWSPDGRVIACPARNVISGLHFEVIEVRVEDGKQKSISSQKWQYVEKLAWLSDSSGLVMIAQDEASARQVWQLSYPSGEARKITNDLNSYSGLSLTADSSALVTVQSEQVSNLWIAPSGEASRARQITSGTGTNDGIEGISWTPDSSIVYHSTVAGTDDLWIIAPDGANPKKLTTSANDYSPSVSPDGHFIVFGSNRSGNPHIWRMDIDGSNSRQLTSGNLDFLPQCSPDGKWVVYTSLSDRPSLWKVLIDGGEAVQLSDQSVRARSPAISPDGKQIAFSYRPQSTNSWTIAVMPFAGGQPTRIFSTELTIKADIALDTIRWTADGRALTYIDTSKGVSNIWTQPLDGSPSKHLTDFKTHRIFNFDWSRDGKWLALARGTVTNDVVLIEDLK